MSATVLEHAKLDGRRNYKVIGGQLHQLESVDRQTFRASLMVDEQVLFKAESTIDFVCALRDLASQVDAFRENNVSKIADAIRRAQ